MCKSCESGGKPLAAVWWRVSTPGQVELSPETQVKDSKVLLESQGYLVSGERIIGAVWHSLDTLECPEMQTLLSWVQHEEIHAIGMVNSDRLSGEMAEKMAIMDIAEKRGVKLLGVQGSVDTGPDGQLIETVRTYAKYLQVIRAQQGAKDGQRDRAKLRGLPVNGKATYGFKFRYTGVGRDRVMTALEPDPLTYPIACQIWEMAKRGYSSPKIAKVLNSGGIPTTKGALGWHRMTIQHLLRNPVYAGVYHALRNEKRKPQERRNAKGGYGKTSTFTKPTEEWYPLPDFPVESPIVTMEEFEVVQNRLSANKLNAARRGKRFYLLKGMLFCEADGKRMVGYTNKRSQWPRYRCSSENERASGLPCCGRPSVAGRIAESLVWEKVRGFLLEPEMFYAEMDRRIEGVQTKEEDVRQRIRSLERRGADVVRRETELVSLKLRGVVSDVALDRNASLLRAERNHIQDEIGRQQGELIALKESQAGVEAIRLLRERMVGKLNSTSTEDRRFILEAVDTRVTVKQDKMLEISPGVPGLTAPICEPNSPMFVQW